MRHAVARQLRGCGTCSRRILSPPQSAPSPLLALALVPTFPTLSRSQPRIRVQDRPFSASTPLSESHSSPASHILSITSSAPSASPPDDFPDLSKLLAIVETTRTRFLSIDGIPTRELTRVALGTCLRAARTLNPYIARYLKPVLRQQQQQQQHHHGSSHASATDPQSLAGRLRAAVEQISGTAHEIIAHPPVVITPPLLSVYVEIQAQLNTAASIPETLELFATKPLPRAAGDKIRYSRQNPNRSAAAIHETIAARALDTAISAHDLGAAVEISKVCYATPASKRQYLFRHAAGPAVAALVMPPMAYGIASGLGQMQWVADPATASWFAFAGIMTYVITNGALATVARLSDMDHMKRVTWLPGTTLVEKWMGEPERAALDKVACAWGFKQGTRYGEESGQDWEALRQYVYLRGMILDRVEFMEGMNP